MESELDVRGKVSGFKHETIPIEEYYFVGYAKKDFEIGSIFEIEGEYVQLEKVYYYEADRHMEKIDCGWKSICKFKSLSDRNPLEDLPREESWTGSKEKKIITDVTQQYLRDNKLNQILKNGNS